MAPHKQFSAAQGMHGFTMIELMVAITILAILAGVAVPSFRDYTANQRIRTAGFNLTSDLMLARSEALKRNRNVTIQASGGGWPAGWSVVVTGIATQLSSNNGAGSHVTFTGAPTSITFNSAGRVGAPAGTIQMQLSATSGSSTLYRCIELDPSGRPRSLAEACT